MNIFSICNVWLILPAIQVLVMGFEHLVHLVPSDQKVQIINSTKALRKQPCELENIVEWEALNLRTFRKRKTKYNGESMLPKIS